MIRAMILDDEQPSVDKLERLLTDSGMADVKKKFTEPLAALEFLKDNPVDAVFLDIKMPDMDGIELSSRITRLQDSIAIVFVTAYNEYAVEAFRINALDFLMKPVTAVRLKETLDRIVKERDIPIQPAKALVQCLGRFRTTDGTNEVKFRTEKAEELFAFLVDQRGDYISRSRIIDCLWEQHREDRALNLFNTTLHYVKKALLQCDINIPIQYDKGSYRIDTSGFSCDYYSFYAVTSFAVSINDANISEFEEAAGLYKGDYLSAKEFVWAERNRQMLKDQYIRLLLGMAGYFKAAGRHEKSIAWMKAGLTHEPLHKEMNYRLIEALLLCDDRISALRYYNIYRKGLRKKLGQEPDEAFRALVE
ncbi:MAG TPA: response regulator [Clostridia bacterium]|nr:response regulator [Clostridia bacterium]